MKYFIFKKNIFKRKKKNVEVPNELKLFFQYISHSGYSRENKQKRMIFDDILSNFKKNNDEYNVYISSTFNGVTYPSFDLDTIELKNTFMDIYSGVPYIIFQSSKNKYWGILANPNKNIFDDTKWLTCNDPQYVRFSKLRNGFQIRGLYENFKRKPIVVEKNGDYSENFQKFIKKLKSFYNSEALELSVLKYKTPELILRYDRKLKLKKLDVKNEN